MPGIIQAPKKIVPTSALPEKPSSTLKELPRAVADIFTPSTQKLGGYTGNLLSHMGASSKQQNESAMDEALANWKLSKLLRGKSKEEQERIKGLIGSGSQVQTAGEATPLPSNKQMVGAIVGTGTEALTGSLAKGVTTKAPTVLKGVVSGAAHGAAFGGARGASFAMEEDAPTEEIIKRGATGAIVGGAAGGTFGGLTAKAGQQAATRKAQDLIPDKPVSVVGREVADEAPGFPHLKNVVDGEAGGNPAISQPVKGDGPGAHLASRSLAEEAGEGASNSLVRKARKYATPEEFVKATTKDTLGAFDDKLHNLERVSGSGTKFDVNILNPVDKKFVEVDGDLVRVFRATKNNEILPGDFVALHPKTAEMFLASESGGRAGGKVISAWVPKNDVVMNGGYWNYRPDGLDSLEAVWNKAHGVIPDELVARSTTTAQDVGTVLSEKGRQVGEFVEEAPYRIKTAAKVAREAQEAMAGTSEQAHRAVASGVPLRKVKVATQSTPEESKLLNTIVDEFERYAKGESFEDPRGPVGEALRTTVKAAADLADERGSLLGEAAEELQGKPLRAKLKVLDRLHKVPGLKGLRIDNTGDLDFSHTNMKTPATQPQRNAINKMFHAITGEDAGGLHMLREEIYQVQGGAKAAQVPMTETEDRAMEAIRQGIADAIEEISEKYRELNKDYAKIASPLSEIRKGWKGYKYAEGDILNARGAQIIKGLTGESGAGLKTEAALESLQKELTKAGKPSPYNFKRIQEILNEIAKHYDLVKETGAEGVVTSGVGRGIRGTIGKAIDFAVGAISKTPELEKQALIDLIRSLPH